MKPLGVVLAGGLSRRMEGPEKSLLKLGGKSLIEQILERISLQLETVIINANGDAARFSGLNVPVQADTVEGFVGPLAGVLAGMRWAQSNTDLTHVITAAADTPFFPSDYCEKMITSAKRENADIALASSDGSRHPVFGLWPVAFADALEHFLVEEENRKVMLFVERYSHCLVEFKNENHDPFFNVNTPEEFALAETMILEAMR